MRAVLLLFVFVGCTPAPPIATAADAQRANVQLAELEAGRKLVVGKCAACHKPPMPTDEWQPLMDDMAKKSRLDATQRRLVEQYLTVMER